jgi:antitoxin VapB
MSLSIKNERVHQLARETARRTGRSQTSVIEEALSRLLAELDREPRAADRQIRLGQLLADVDARLEGKGLWQGSADELYDDAGLPA